MKPVNQTVGKECCFYPRFQGIFLQDKCYKCNGGKQFFHAMNLPMGRGAARTHEAAAPVQLPQLLLLHSWNLDERHPQVGRYLVSGLGKGWRETFVTWIDF